MKQIVIKYGIIAGLILSAMIFTIGAVIGQTTNFEKGEIYGYMFMVAAFSTIFFGIRDLRDKIQDGEINFNKAFRTGLIITIIGSVFYVIAWMIYFNLIDNTFVERYTEYYIGKVNASGQTPDQIAKEIQSFKENMKNYNNPLVMALFTFLEVFPIGLSVSILCAFIMKRKK
jgi:hypothetical protein